MTTHADEAGVELAALADYLAQGGVTQLAIVERVIGRYQLEVLLTWRARRCPLVAARGGPRTFRRLETLVRLLRDIGVGNTAIRLELKT